MTRLTSKCASGHNGVHFFDIWTSNSGPNMWCFTILTWKCSSRHNGVHFSTSERQKVVRTCGAFTILTWKCSSRHNGVHFLDISTSKRTLCALYILTWKCSSRHNGVHFLDISTSKRTLCALYILTWKCASRHNGVHFLDISTSKRTLWHCVLCTFWLGNVLRATTGCTFSKRSASKSTKCVSHRYTETGFRVCAHRNTDTPKTPRIHVAPQVNMWFVYLSAPGLRGRGSVRRPRKCTYRQG